MHFQSANRVKRFPPSFGLLVDPRKRRGGIKSIKKKKKKEGEAVNKATNRRSKLVLCEGTRGGPFYPVSRGPLVMKIVILIGKNST